MGLDIAPVILLLKGFNNDQPSREISRPKFSLRVQALKLHRFASGTFWCQVVGGEKGLLHSLNALFTSSYSGVQTSKFVLQFTRERWVA